MPRYALERLHAFEWGREDSSGGAGCRALHVPFEDLCRSSRMHLMESASVEQHTCVRVDPGEMRRQRRILIVAPTRHEFSVVRAALADLSDDGVELASCGVGPVATTAFCRRLDCRPPVPRTLVLLGYAGGLDPGLVPGDLVLADAVLNARGERVTCTPLNIPAVRVGPLLSVAEPLRTPGEKRAAAHSGAIAVEMEAYPLGVWARTRGLPFVHARVVLDAADEPLPDLGDALGVAGEVDWRRLAQAVLIRPGLVAPLLQLARRARDVRPALAELARAVVRTS